MRPSMGAHGRMGFRVLDAPPRLAEALVEPFRGLASSTVADAMGRFNFMTAIEMRTGRPVCGRAVTVNCRPADNLMVHKAIDVASPGDVLVVRTGGNVTNAVFGELMARAAVARGLGGIVVDGAVRDVSGIAALGLPAFSRAVSPGACDKDGPGEINVPIACGDTVVMPGDVIVGDADGVAVVPRDQAAAVLEAAAAIVERERVRLAEIAQGKIVKPEIDAVLRRHGAIE